MRVRRTFAFLDLSGFTALTESEGDERAVTILGVFRAALRDICSRRGVRIAKWLGDGAMLVSVETMSLVAAALETKSAIEAAPEPITLKCGVTTGAVILLEGDDYVGHAVNVAARLCDLAVGHEILAAAAVVPDIPPWATVEVGEPMLVRGLEQAVEVVRLGLPATDPDSHPDPVCRIPLTPATAVARRRDTDGTEVLFCAESCAEMWGQRRTPAPLETGALREMWLR
ncbi:MAG TPA: adenylate/guanylate cyclase domain-containing protein [Acidimicrobiales bacterium]|nr:adenylate/guanylate cyclase domain-containing protein [Acidimicrobiales bacterium]